MRGDPEGAACHDGAKGAQRAPAGFGAVALSRQRGRGRRLKAGIGVGTGQQADPAADVEVHPAEVAQPLTKGALAVIAVGGGGDAAQDPRQPVFVALRVRQLLHQRVDGVVKRLRRVGPVKQHAAQAGEHAGQAQLLVQHVVEHVVLAAKAVVAPERLNAQQVHGENLADHRFMGGAHLINLGRLQQQPGVLQQARVHLLQRGDQRLAVRGARQHHHHKSGAQDA